MRFLLAFTLVFPLLLSGQRTWSVTAFAASGTTTYSAPLQAPIAETAYIINRRHVNAQRAGAALGLDFEAGFHLGLFLQYSEYGTYSRYDDVGPLRGADLPTRFDFTDRNEYAEGLILLRQHFFVDKRLRPFAELGVGAARYLMTDFSFTSFGSIAGVFNISGRRFYDNIRPWTVTGRLAAGLDWRFLKRFDLYGAAVYQRQFWSLRKGNERRAFPWQVTAEFGVRYVLTKPVV